MAVTTQKPSDATASAATDAEGVSTAPLGGPVRWLKGRFTQDNIAFVVVVGAILLAMEIASHFVPAYIAPPPVAVLGRVWDSLFTLGDEMLVTLVRLLVALAFSLVVGTALGVIMGMFRRARPYLRALVIIDTGIPALSWMVIAVFWFKDPEARIFFILTVILLPFYALNVHDGIKALSRELVEMCESFRPSRWQMLRYLILPHILSYVLLTTKSIIGYASRMVIFAELIGSTVGVGAQMSIAQSTFDMEAVVALTVVLVIFNLLAQQGVMLLERRVLRWRPEVKVR